MFANAGLKMFATMAGAHEKSNDYLGALRNLDDDAKFIGSFDKPEPVFGSQRVGNATQAIKPHAKAYSTITKTIEAVTSGAKTYQAMKDGRVVDSLKYGTKTLGKGIGAIGGFSGNKALGPLGSGLEAVSEGVQTVQHLQGGRYGTARRSRAGRARSAAP
jgi:hypothetical protein